MPGSAYDAVQQKNNALIFKAKRGSVFVAPFASDPITSLTDTTDKLLTALPTGYTDVGWTSDDGAQFSRDVETSDITGWGSVEPLRSDITQDTTTLQIACYELKKTTLGLYTGADMSAVTPAANGEIHIDKPADPGSLYYRVLAVAVDRNEDGEVYYARFLPRAKVTDYDDQNLQSSDDSPVTFPVTLTSYVDEVLGYSERTIVAGPGWTASWATAAGFTIPSP